MAEKPKKRIAVKFSSEFDSEYSKLLEEVGREKKRSIKNSFNNQLMKAIDRIIEQLSVEPTHGVHVPKNRIPEKYIREYGINNLWKANLPGAWRLLYTLNTDKLEILTILLEYMDHNRYNKLFGYRKR